MKHIHTKLINYLKESNSSLIDTILDKVNKDGLLSLTFDERTYLDQNSNGNIDPELEKWLLSNDPLTLDYDDNKLPFDEFGESEDIFFNPKKLIRYVSKKFGDWFSNNADWSGGKVWSLGDNHYIYYGDDDLVLLKRTLNEDDEYVDQEIIGAKDSKELDRLMLRADEIKNKKRL
jgi:hypothetical protein